MSYAATSPLISPNPPPDVGRLAAAVWRRVAAAHPRATTAYTQAEVCGGAGYEGIVPAYVRVCLLAGLDVVLALAQLLHETDAMASWWAGRPRRNPAGLFVTGATRASTPPAREGDLWQPRGQSWARGQAYSNWISSPLFRWRPNSVDAHVWRLCGYARATLTPDQELLYVRACQGRPLPWFVRGSALTVRALGRAHNPMRALGAGWASPGDRYGESLARLANGLIEGA